MTTRLDKIDIEESLEAETVASERVYVGKDKSNGYFYSDNTNRTAFTGGNFYLETSVPTFYNYAGQTYHGQSGGGDKPQKFTNNTLSGDDWSISGSTGKFTTTGAVSAYSMNAYGVTASVFTEGSTTLANKYLGKSGGTMTGQLALSDSGYSLGNAFQKWATTYTVKIDTPKELLSNTGGSLNNGGVYKFTAHIAGTGTDQFATAVYWNQNGTWIINVTGQSGTSSNHPQFILDVDSGKPTLYSAHSNNYIVYVLAERIELHEGSGTDNAGYAFGTDAYLGSTAGNLYFSPNGHQTRGAGVYNDGNIVWHSGNDGAGSGLDADKLDGYDSGAFAKLSNSQTFTGANNFTSTIKTPITYGTVVSAGGSYSDLLGVNDPAGGAYFGGNGHYIRSGNSTKAARITKASGTFDIWHAGNFGKTQIDALNIDADKLDGLSSASFLRSDVADTVAGKLTLNNPLARSSHNTGHLEGSYNNVGDNASKTNPIYAIGSSYAPNVSTLGNMYGIGYASSSSASFLSGALDAGGTGWGMYVAADGDARVFLNGHSGTIATTGQHYANGSLVWNAGNDGSGSGLDADMVDGYHASKNNASNTVVVRDSSTDIKARLFRSEYTSTNSNINYIMTQIATGTGDNYVRPSTPAQVRAGLGIEAGATADQTKYDIDLLNVASQSVKSNTGTLAHNSLSYINSSGANEYNPTSDWWNKIVMAHGDPDAYYNTTLAMKMTGSNSGELQTRVKTGGNWGSWKKVFGEGNFGKAQIDALNIDADTLDGISSGGFVRNNGTWTGGSGSPHTVLASSFAASGDTKFTFYGNGGAMDVVADGDFYASEGTNKLFHAGNFGKTEIDALNVDADTLDGLNSSQFVRNDQDGITTGSLTVKNTSPYLTVQSTDGGNSHVRFMNSSGDETAMLYAGHTGDLTMRVGKRAKSHFFNANGDITLVGTTTSQAVKTQGAVPVSVTADAMGGGDVLWDPTAFIENGATASESGGSGQTGHHTILPVGAPRAKGWSITGGKSVYSDLIPVTAGETLSLEVTSMQTGTTARFYLGIERYDRNKKRLSSNNGCVYIAAANTTLTQNVWTTRTGYHTIPSSHTPYDGSDGGAVCYVKVRLLMNYSTSGQAYYTGVKLTRSKQVRADFGSQLQPSLTFAADDDTGFYRSNPNEISVTVGNDTRARFTTGGYGLTMYSGIHANGNDINHANGLHFKSGARFYDYNSTELIVAGSTVNGGLRFTDSSQNYKGKVYWSASGFGLINPAGNWGVLTTATQTNLYHQGDAVKLETKADGIKVNGQITTANIARIRSASVGSSWIYDELVSNGVQCHLAYNSAAHSGAPAHSYHIRPNGGSTSYLYVSSGKVGVQTDLEVTGAANLNGGIKQDGHSIFNGNDTWVRTKDVGGIYFSTHAGGLHMTDSTWIRTYGTKKFLVDNSSVDAIKTNGGIQLAEGNNYGRGVTGKYSSLKFQGVFAMGDSYQLPADGTTSGNLYGIAWTHSNNTNANGSKISGHHATFMSNGVTKSAIGDHIWTNGTVTAESNITSKGNIQSLGNVEIGTYGTTGTGSLILNGSTANKQAVVKCSNGNLHLDAHNGHHVYLNYWSEGSLYLGKAGTSYLTNDGDLTIKRNITAKGNISAEGSHFYGDNKEMFQFNDSWLRINELKQFTSGIFCGQGKLRTDGQFEVGSNGDKFKVTSAGAVTALGKIEAKAGIDVRDKWISWDNIDAPSNTTARSNTVPNSIALLDVYNNAANYQSQYGTVLEIQGRSGHQVNQLMLGNNGRIYNRDAFYNQTNYGDWNELVQTGLTNTFTAAQTHTQPLTIDTGGSVPDNTVGTYNKGLTIESGNQRMVIDASSTSNGGGYIQMRHEHTTYSNYYYELKLNPLGGNVSAGANFSATGTITGTDCIATSDSRVKDNIAVIEDASGKLDKLSGNTFNRVDMDGRLHAGVIAQEVQAVLPEAIFITDDEAMDDGKKLNVSTSAMIGLLVQGHKEQAEKIAKLEKMVELLMGGK